MKALSADSTLFFTGIVATSCVLLSARAAACPEDVEGLLRQRGSTRQQGEIKGARVGRRKAYWLGTLFVHNLADVDAVLLDR
jgi:hypothetical protein